MTKAEMREYETLATRVGNNRATVLDEARLNELGHKKIEEMKRLSPELAFNSMTKEEEKETEVELAKEERPSYRYRWYHKKNKK